MTEVNTPPTDRIEPVDIQVEMQRSYIDYAMSVIVTRALPDVRDGLKPVHRRVLYAMYDGGYRPDRGYFKCSRVVGDVMGSFHPHGDAPIYDALVRLAQPWSLRYPLVDGQGNFGSPGNDTAAAMRYTESKLAPIAMEMLRDIDKDTVDFQPNYDGRSQEPKVLPSRFPNLLVNGSAGIAVGMATNIPPHNLREVAEGVQWCLDNPGVSDDELLAALMLRIKGPDFPTSALIVGRKGIEEAYRTGRGSITMRAVVEVEEDVKGRQCLVVTELPYQVNPDNLALKIAEQVKEGKISGIADVRDETSARTGQRLVIVLKRDAVAKVVLNNLYKHTQLQDTFGANMLALVDGVPRTLRLDQFVRHYVTHQIEVVVRRTRYLLRKAEERAHILRALLKALDRLDDVIALIRASESAAAAQRGLMDLLEIDEIQAQAILDMQLRKLAALERQQIVDEHAALMTQIADYQDILASETRQRTIVSEELAEIVARYGDERRTQIIAYDGDMSVEDLIAEDDVVVTITRGGYAKRTKTDLYRAQRRGGKGVRGAALRQDDIVDHFFVTTTHHWLLFFTDRGRVYRIKAYELPDTARDARGQHVANLLALQADERIMEVLDLRDYEAAPYLVLATRSGLVKKTRLSEYDSPRSGGLIAINLREDDEVIAARLISESDDLLLVSRGAQAIRFTASDEALRPMGRATSGVKGMSFRDGDDLLSMNVIREGTFVFTATDGGFAKRTAVEEYRVQGRGGLGIKAAKIVEGRGHLVGALVVDETDEVMAITSGGGVIRTRVAEVRDTGRDTMGVQLINLGKGDSVVGVARNAESLETSLEATPETDENGGGE
ncbi:DNA gyrase subunit A [Rhizohabitans arisaemae]|uniref:DNA gyrase subunit A n=1 Tax=Rhizohabitans arisaemae TaxID=2720610 RepID=UPI0024B24A0B|nr:DNA gyrase subunit A [Rhizohabitans arisaemae]